MKTSSLPLRPLAVLLLATTALAVDPQPTQPKDECCKEQAASAFTKASLYQTDARFTDDGGRPVTLGALRGRPVVLTMFFSSCGYACPLLVSDMARIRELLPTGLREEVAFVLVSFDVARDTPPVLRAYRESRHLDAQWILLHGAGTDVRELAALLGVKYKQEADGNFAHSNLLTVLNREGEIVHQRTGLKDGHAETAAALAALATRPPGTRN